MEPQAGRVEVSMNPLPSPQTAPPAILQTASIAAQQLGPLDAWKVAREAIKHEDDLTNHRLTWLLLLHGFLFAGMGAIIQGIAGSGRFDRLLFLVTLVIGFVGLLSPFFVWITLHAAVCHVQRVTRWWEEEYGRLEPDGAAAPHLQMFPPVRGHDYDKHRIRLLEHLARPIHLPWLLMFAWLVILFTTIVTYTTAARTSTERWGEETITNPSAGPNTPVTIKRTEKP